MAASGVRRCNFISTAEFHSSSTPYNESQLLFPRLMCSRRRGEGCVRAHTPPYPPVPTSTSTEFHFCKLFFHFVVSREHAAFLPPFSSKPRKHDKSSLSLSLSLVSFSSAHVVSSSFFFVPR